LLTTHRGHGTRFVLRADEKLTGLWNCRGRYTSSLLVRWRRCGEANENYDPISTAILTDGGIFGLTTALIRDDLALSSIVDAAAERVTTSRHSSRRSSTADPSVGV